MTEPIDFEKRREQAHVEALKNTPNIIVEEMTFVCEVVKPEGDKMKPEPSEHFPYFKKMYDDHQYEKLCGEYCHEGLRTEEVNKIWTASVCSERAIGPTKEKAIFYLAALLLGKLERGEVDAGC